MCLPGQPPAEPVTAVPVPVTAASAAGVPVSAADAVAMAQAGLAFLAQADMGSLPAAVQADCLRGLERAATLHTAARTGVLAAFMTGGGQEDDGHGSAK